MREAREPWFDCSRVREYAKIRTVLQSISGMIFVPSQELSCVMRTLFFSFLFLVRYHPLHFQRSGGAARGA